MNILKVKDLTVANKEGKIILRNVSFNVEKNSIHIILGPNGSGKSTLAYALMGIPRFKITSGQIIFRGRDITKLSTTERAKMGITLAFQEPAYFEGIKVKDFLRAGNSEISQKDLEESLSLVGLSPSKFLERMIDKTLSGGERKRIEFASVIAMKPKLMILDEPDSGLDIIIYRELYNILENMKEKTGVSILLISHREEPGFLANKATFLYQGKIVCSGNFKKVMRKYCQTVNRKKICRNCQENL